MAMAEAAGISGATALGMERRWRWWGWLGAAVLRGWGAAMATALPGADGAAGMADAAGDGAAGVSVAAGDGAAGMSVAAGDGAAAGWRGRRRWPIWRGQSGGKKIRAAAVISQGNTPIWGNSR